MATEIPWETRCRAEELYIFDNHTFDQVAEMTGVSVSQLKRWAAEGGWRERKKEYREAIADSRRKSILLRQKMVEKAFSSLEPQDVYAAVKAAAALEKIMPAERQKKEAEVDRPRLFLEGLQFIAETLKEIDPEGLKVLSRNFDALVRRFKEEYEGAT